MGEWECTVCGYLYEGEVPPATCPDCGAASDRMIRVPYAGDDEWDEDLDDDTDEFDEDWDVQLKWAGQETGQPDDEASGPGPG